MDIIEVKDLTALEHHHAVEHATCEHDFVALPVDPIEEQAPVVEGHQPAGEHVTYYVGYADGVPVGALTLTLFTLDNLTAANVDGSVHPAYRRQGFGRQLMGHALDAVRSAGRSRVFVEAPWMPDGGEGPAFPLLRAVGAKPVLEDIRRLLDLQAFPPGDPMAPPPGYRVVQWVDTAPDDVVDGLAYLLHRMVLDAPMGEMDIEPERWDRARYRESEVSAQRRRRTRFTTVVLHEDSGEVAGMTEIMVHRSRPEVATQWNTIVDPRHRGHRLGMVLKSWNHRSLVEHVPEARWINTWNAASNTFMIDVNEQLGFRVAEKWTEWQLDLAP